MSESKHTPGPWSIRRSGNGYPYQIMARDQDNRIPGRVGQNITRWGAITLPSSEEGEANALLISTAPELLDMLERCELWLSTKPEGRNMQLQCQRIIAKAKGQP